MPSGALGRPETLRSPCSRGERQYCGNERNSPLRSMKECRKGAVGAASTARVYVSFLPLTPWGLHGSACRTFAESQTPTHTATPHGYATMSRSESLSAVPHALPTWSRIFLNGLRVTIFNARPTSVQHVL
jgi:hypothetical protein